MNYDYGYHYYNSFEKYCKVGDTACKEQSDTKNLIGLSLGVGATVAVFLLVAFIIWRTVYKGKMRTQYKGKWEFLNDTDMTGREGKKLIKNLKKVRSSFVEGEDITAKFDTLSDSEDSAD